MQRLLSSSFALLFVVATRILAEDPGERTDSVVWDFNTADQLPGQTVGLARIVPGTLHGPVYPAFSAGNRVLELAAPSWIRIPDDGDDRFDFTTGDEVTFEAWVRLQSIGENMCVIGKGRTGTSGYKAINQNWAFRLRKVAGTARLNLLFRSQDGADHKGDWHRWTSDSGITAGRRWHHIAISYRFGDPQSIRGVLDGRVVKGRWDMGGPTEAPPVVDDDEVWIGSTMAGNKSNSFDGAIDQLAVHRRILPPEQLQQRFRWNPPKASPPQIPPGQVVMQMFESDASVSEFPLDAGAPLLQWTQEEMALADLPHAYDRWGVRTDWPSTVLVRAWTRLSLPPGRHRLLVRSRGRSRVLLNDETIAETARQKNTTNAHQKVVELPPVPFPDMRPAAMADHETLVEIDSDGTSPLLLWEMVVGGPQYRLETGENSLAVATPEGMFHLVSAVSQIPLTDAGWLAFADRQRQQLQQLDRSRRRRADPQIDAYWRKRHQQAEQLIVASAEIPSIDRVIEQRRQQFTQRPSSGSADAKQTHFYTTSVQPILQQHCGRCHVQKQQGGLRLSDRDSLLRGGDSGEASVVPGKPDESPLLQLVAAAAEDYRMPPLGDGLSEQEIATVRRWIEQGAVMPDSALPDVSVPPQIDDHTFLRRVYLDTVGVPPTRHEAVDFLNDPSANRRQRLIRRLLRDERWADNWTGYWQDVLAENPNLLKPTLNNTGPFRYWIHEALEDNKPVDRFATELMTMRGSRWSGGAAGFEMASQNDVPMAAKAMVVSSAFLGVNLKCARCHDAPYHEWTQGQLFQLAAMLDRNRLTLPASSTVPPAFFEQQPRKPLIEVSLKPGAEITGQFPFPQFNSQVGSSLMQNSGDSRELAALKITTSRRFAEVIANRVWQRLMGAGVVDPVDDWAGNPPSSPELLATLADLLIVHHYDMKALVEEILNSHVYQRQAVDRSTGHRLFAGPLRRRMSAEQIVDSAFHVTGMRMRTEELTLDVEGAHPSSRFLNFGYPQHAWEYTTLANERDRPSLSLPRVQAVTDVLRAFGWRDARPEPASHRDMTPNLIQPGVLANGTLGVWLTRLSEDHGLLPLMLSARNLDDLIDELYLRLLTRRPTARERRELRALLQDGFERRVISDPPASAARSARSERFPYVSWSNHLNTRANVIKQRMQELARQGDPPTSRLESDWRERAEDAIWSLLNSPEMILIP